MPVQYERGIVAIMPITLIGCKMLRFFWNGIKDNGGKLQTCHYSGGATISFPDGTITIYNRQYVSFSAGVQAAFSVQDDTDIQSDYIVREHIRVRPDHPLYADVAGALLAQGEHHAKQARKQAARCVAAHA